MAKDFYDILGVSRNASQDDIKKAYRKLAHQHHPDKGGGDEAKFKEVNEAYQVLGNEEKRGKYDQFGSAYQNTAGGQGAAGFNWQDFAQSGGGFGSQNVEFDLGDLFGDMFGFSSSRSRKSRGNESGRDMSVEMVIPFSDAVFGSKRDIEIDRLVTCNRCEGIGGEPGSETKTCSTCRGSGEVQQVQQSFLGQFATRTACPTCKGEGKIISDPCKKCHGQGREKSRSAIRVTIPAGISEGERVRLSGQGEAGVRGSEAGDLYITFRIQADSRFTRLGDNITSTHTISIADAVLGTTIEVETVDGLVKLKIPAGTESGKQFILRGKGVTHLRSRGRGDHLVRVEVTIPKKLSKQEKRLFEELRAF